MLDQGQICSYVRRKQVFFVKYVTLHVFHFSLLTADLLIYNAEQTSCDIVKGRLPQIETTSM